MAKKDNERVIQTRLGRQSIAPERVVYFPKGLIGFEGEHEFTLLQIKQGSPFLILQSLTDPRLGLLVADPYAFVPDFELKIGDAEQKILRIENIRQVAVLVTVTIPQGEPEKTALSLTGPVVINTQARIGLQVPQVDSKYTGQYLVGTGGVGSGKGKGEERG